MNKSAWIIGGFVTFGLLLSACTTSQPPAGEQASRRQPVADEATDAAARGLIQCLITYQRRHEAKLVVPPQDYERMISSACIQEKSDFRTASVAYFIRVGVRDGILISTKINEQIAKLEQISVGKYTEAFYATK